MKHLLDIYENVTTLSKYFVVTKQLKRLLFWVPVCCPNTNHLLATLLTFRQLCSGESTIKRLQTKTLYNCLDLINIQQTAP